jgi:hypothetical protein
MRDSVVQLVVAQFCLLCRACTGAAVLWPIAHDVWFSCTACCYVVLQCVMHDALYRHALAYYCNLAMKQDRYITDEHA